MRTERDPGEHMGKNPNTTEETPQSAAFTPWDERAFSGANGLVQRIEHTIIGHLADSTEDTSIEIPE